VVIGRVVGGALHVHLCSPMFAGIGSSARRATARVKVRDLTPQDPGNRYDFGEWANSMIGATLSLFVEDTSLLSPFG